MTKGYGRMAIVPLILTLAWAGDAHARYAPREIQNIPLERLIRNLERAVSEHPEDAALYHHLARTQAMAWARRLADESEVEVVERTEGVREPWFGYGETRAIPFAPAEPLEAGSAWRGAMSRRGRRGPRSRATGSLSNRLGRKTHSRRAGSVRI